MSIQRIDHVQLAMPPGREKEAREFYADLLGIPEVPKPASMSASGGAWFERGSLKVHLGVQADFSPATKAHPAFRISGLGDLRASLERAGIEVLPDNRLPGLDRFFAKDPFGNRLEFLEPTQTTQMEPEPFIQKYESALATQDWSAVEPLMHKDVCVTFSSGAVHRGLGAVQKAFQANFAAISCEQYKVSNVHWIQKTTEHAVYLFNFDWSGILHGESASGGGRGTSVLVRNGEKWQLLTEHLGLRD